MSSLVHHNNTLSFNRVCHLHCWCGIIEKIVPLHICDNASDPSTWHISLSKLDYLLMIVQCIYMYTFDEMLSMIIFSEFLYCKSRAH